MKAFLISFSRNPIPTFGDSSVSLDTLRTRTELWNPFTKCHSADWLLLGSWSCAYFSSSFSKFCNNGRSK